MPAASNDDAKDRALNRRVEVRVLVSKGLQAGFTGRKRSAVIQRLPNARDSSPVCSHECAGRLSGSSHALLGAGIHKRGPSY